MKSFSKKRSVSPLENQPCSRNNDRVTPNLIKRPFEKSAIWVHVWKDNQGYNKPGSNTGFEFGWWYISNLS